MSRIAIAFSAWFSLLFRGRLPPRAAVYLPPEALPPPTTSRTAAAEAPPKPSPTSTDETALRTEGALVLLTLLQREGRFLDFLRESLDDYDDTAIGVAVRDIHRDCRKVLEAHIKVEHLAQFHCCLKVFDH